MKVFIAFNFKITCFYTFLYRQPSTTQRRQKFSFKGTLGKTTLVSVFKEI